MLEKGLLQVYTSDTSRFNFAPIGLSFRAAGQELRTLVTCFQPHELMDGAATISSLLRPNLVIDHSSFRTAKRGRKAEEKATYSAFQKAREALSSRDFDMVILNGIHSILDRKIVTLESFLTLIENKPARAELVLTGTNIPVEILERADLVTEMVVHSLEGNSDKKKVSTKKGYVEVVTGDGKGKTTYCLGKALLSSSLGVRSIMLQFIKSVQPYGEIKALRRFPMLKIISMGKGFLNYYSISDYRKHLNAAKKAWEKCIRAILSAEYGLIVLDEINTATFHGFIQPENIRKICSLKPRDLQLLLSGRNAHAEVLAAASTVIEMKQIKHPFAKGIGARKGIEY